FWARANRLPTAMLAMASTATTIDQNSVCPAKTTISTRSSTANPAALEAVERKPATAVGAPSYTSGAQKWKGTAEILKPKPTSTIGKAPPSATAETCPAASRSASTNICVVPPNP